MEEVIKIAAAGIAVLTFILAHFNNEQKRLDEMKRMYFENVLVSYVNKHKYNKEINTVRYIKRTFSIKDYYIPSYIFYLAEQNDVIKLNKILHQDYWEYYPNNYNSIFKSIFKFISSIHYIWVTFSLFLINLLIISGLVNFITVIINLFTEFTYLKLFATIVGLFIYIGMLYGVILVFRRSIKSVDDDYALSVKKIEKNIKSKLKGYEKNYKKNFIK